MQKHTKVYYTQMGFDDCDFVPCEVTNGEAVDIHHIRGRGRGGKDTLCNLMALTRESHVQFGDKKNYTEFLLGAHFVKIYRKMERGWINPRQHIFESALSGCKESKLFIERYPKEFTELWFDFAGANMVQ